ncbi:MAG: hypothetical protein ACFFB5_23270 [Promethearchaeota archaeon]
MKYAHQNASGWYTAIVDSTGEIGRYSSLTVDTSGYAHISYHDSTNGYLKYAYQDGSGWHITTVDTTSYVGMFTSQTLDTSGYAHISYFDAAGALKYAYQNASGWHTATVDATDDAGWDTSLALDASGYAHISYREYTNNDLRYAYQDATGWYVETVDSTSDLDFGTSLALDISGYAHISYYDSTNDDLMYAYKDASGWHTAIVDSTGDVGRYASLALDASGYACISYCDISKSALKWAYQDASGWHTATVDSTDEVGLYTSLVLDASGHAHISYRDYTNTALKYIKSNFPVTTAGKIPILLSPVDGAILTDASPLLEWTEVSGTTYYAVQVDEDASFTWPWLVDINAYTTSNELSTLPNGKYYWRIQAIDAEGTIGPWSSVWSFTIAAEVPTLISPANGAILTDTTPLLKWTEVNDTVEYVVQVDDGAAFDFPRIIDVGVTTTSYKTSHLAVGTYYWRVNAVDATGNSSPWSSVWSFTIGEETTSSGVSTSSEGTTSSTVSTSSEKSTTSTTSLTPGFGTICIIGLFSIVGINSFKHRKD